jgi:hypothetical protein
MDLAAEYFHRHTPLPRELCQVIAAFYEPLLSELVERYLARHRTCTIVLHACATCVFEHDYFASLRLLMDGNMCRVFTRWQDLPASPFQFDGPIIFAMTHWDALDDLLDYVCLCRIPRLKTDLRVLCESDFRFQWTRLLVRRKRKS